ncbi:MAG: hypothetical protein LBU36_01070 [Clostridiales bacterium]|jgi:hypothetical protein|nr:hypothetical protein [Clostridiales bacterium]
MNPSAMPPFAAQHHTDMTTALLLLAIMCPGALSGESPALLLALLMGRGGGF